MGPVADTTVAMMVVLPMPFSQMKRNRRNCNLDHTCESLLYILCNQYSAKGYLQTLIESTYNKVMHISQDSHHTTLGDVYKLTPLKRSYSGETHVAC